MNTLQNYNVGDSIGELNVTPTKMQLFMFSAITWNRHQIHYNQDQAKSEGFPDVAVQRGLLGNFLSNLISEWTKTNKGTLHQLNWKVTQSTFPKIEIICSGKIKGKIDQGQITQYTLDLNIANTSGDLIAIGDAEVRVQNSTGSNE